MIHYSAQNSSELGDGGEKQREFMRLGVEIRHYARYLENVTSNKNEALIHKHLLRCVSLSSLQYSPATTQSPNWPNVLSSAANLF